MLLPGSDQVKKTAYTLLRLYNWGIAGSRA